MRLRRHLAMLTLLAAIAMSGCTALLSGGKPRDSERQSLESTLPQPHPDTLTAAADAGT